MSLYFVISPAKNLDETSPVPVSEHTEMAFPQDTQGLMGVLKG